MTALKCSVIIPTYNRCRYLKRCIDSILAQTRPVDEIIVVDDGSNDNSLVVLKKHPNIKLISLQKNHGVSYARNRGIEHAQHPWIALLDSDDEWLPHKQENQMNYLLQHPELKILQSNEKWVRNGKIIQQKKHQLKEAGNIWQNALDYCVISASSALMHKELLERHGIFDEDLVACEDFDLWLRITRHCDVGLDEQQSIIKYGGHADQLSYAHPVIDKFRVYALCKALCAENDAQHRQCIIKIIKKKLKIIIQGSTKRGNVKRAERFRHIYDAIEATDAQIALELAKREI